VLTRNIVRSVKARLIVLIVKSVLKSVAVVAVCDVKTVNAAWI